MARVLAALLATVVAGGAPALAQDVPLEPYLGALRAGAVGTVMGRAFEERRRANEPDRPLAGIAVVVMPRSPGLLARLGDLRGQARASARSYRLTATALRLAREAYERALWEAGAADLVLTALSDAHGRFLIDGVPAGDWLLIATRSVFVEAPARSPTRKEREQYVLKPRLVGYHSVTIWLRELNLAAGASDTVELTDRNGWFQGIVEERAAPDPR